MENSSVIFIKLVVLFGFVLIGYLAYRKGWVGERGSAEISKLIVNIFNPALIIATAANTGDRPASHLVLLDALLVIILFAVMIALCPLLVRVLRVPEKDRLIYMIMFVFSNLGFMGIPLIGAVYGTGATFYVSLYILMYNLLFYSVGLQMFKRQIYAGGKFEFKQMVHPGMIACVFAVLLFVTQVRLPDPAIDFISYLSDACVPLSMLITGFALAHADLKKVFTDGRLYGYTIIKMLLVPAAAAMIFRFVPGLHPDPVVAGIMVIMFGMPNGSMPVIVSEEYGMDSDTCSRAFALTTLVTIVTLPVVTLLV